MAAPPKLLARVFPDIAEIGAETWDACANPASAVYDPFISFGFLKALEDSSSVGMEAGWIPQHIVLAQESDPDQVIGVMPTYVKTHSMGEYVFDHSWAHALEAAGGSYYPKLQCAVPFTPVPGRRVLLRDGLDDPVKAERALVSAAVNLAGKLELSSLHITFLTEPEWDRLGSFGLLQRTGQQFHWTNRGFESFDDFLGALSSRKRKSLRKERAEVQAAGLTFTHLRGAEITEAHWDAFFEFYMDTGDRKWGTPYLTRDFFSCLTETLGDQCLLMLANHDGSPVAGALHLIGGDCLYGRYWGMGRHIPFLHFELCYYQAIEFAIAQGLARVEAGAQGEHKLARGYLPVPTYSAHWIREPGLEAAVKRFLERERKDMGTVRAALAEHGPFRKNID